MTNYQLLQANADIIAAQFGSKFHGVATAEGNANIFTYDLDARLNSTQAKALVAVLRALALGISDMSEINKIVHRAHTIPGISVAPSQEIYRVEIPESIACDESFIELIQKHSHNLKDAARHKRRIVSSVSGYPIPVQASTIF